MIPLTWRLLVPFAMLLGTASAPLRAQSGSVSRDIAWESDYEQAMERAAVEYRPVLLTFTAVWCGYCRRMDRETFADSSVISRLDRMICVRVDGDRRSDLVKEYGVRGFPATFLLAPGGSRRESFLGFQEPRSFAAALDRETDSRAEEYVLRQRLADHEELFDARVRLAEILFFRGDVSEATEQYRKALAKAPSGPSQDLVLIRLNYARALIANDRDGEALAELDRIAKIKNGAARTRAVAFFLTARCQGRSGDRKAERRTLSRLLEIWDKGWMADRARERLGG